ncbi:divergent PAP2 family protein [Alicyclobacillus sp.]|uniref:divergent PAP2 family protein n=1 Tax=Alicyclobacillus sp. TaxID=61169 RepID=UPI0025BA98C1|nr:divergent PAP2 family protein [Alicyclobacillus sp.]MCL6516056.1 divergent PAP2 family protein [Alicyclobacillus sp.]
MTNSYHLWLAPLVALVVAQLLKPVIVVIRARRWDPQRLRQSGGMPSSHTALVVALVAELWLHEGGRNPVLALALFVALIVMYDAAGVRWQTGRQAAVLNRLLQDLRRADLAGRRSSHGFRTGRSARPLSEPRPGSDARPVVQSPIQIQVPSVPWWLMDWPELDEHLGHKPIEVLGGCVVGMAVAWILH